ncbi:hypothetical protein ACRTEU_24710, partial [Vibrio alginolyticus]
ASRGLGDVYKRQSQNTAYSMPITPTLAIAPVGSVDETHAATLQFEGTSTPVSYTHLRAHETRSRSRKPSYA